MEINSACLLLCIMAAGITGSRVVHVPIVSDASEGAPSASFEISSKSSISHVSACLWLKSLNTAHIGNLFTMHSGVTTDVEFGLVQARNTDDKFKVAVVVQNQISSKSVELRIDDVRWHHVCVSWSNFKGAWKIFLDGKTIGSGINLNSGAVIPGELRLNMGGGYGELNNYFAGKLTELYVWDRALSPIYVRKIFSCDPEFRKSLATKLQGLEPSPIGFGWAGKALVYSWKPENVVCTNGANMRPTEKLCNPNVVIECQSNHMLVSILKSISDGLKINPTTMHMNDEKCMALSGGKNKTSLVFKMEDLNSCGNIREVTEREVIYTNTISNTPTQPMGIYIGHLFKMNVQCRYPVDIQVTMSSASDDLKSIVEKSPIKGLSSQAGGLEAVSMLFEDETFAKVHEKESISLAEDKLYVGILLKPDSTKDETNPITNVKLSTEECWLSDSGQKVELFKDQGCTNRQPGDYVKVVENGITQQTRFEVSTSLLRNNVPTYIHCAVRSCAGPGCKRTCPGEKDRQRRDASNEINNGDLSYIHIGPIYRNVTSYSIAKEQQISGIESVPLPLLFVIGSLIIVTLVTCSLLIYFLCRRHRTISHEDDSNAIRSRGKVRPRSASIGSFGSMTLSSSFPSTLSIDLYGDDTSCESLEFPYYVNQSY